MDLANYVSIGANLVLLCVKLYAFYMTGTYLFSLLSTPTSRCLNLSIFISLLSHLTGFKGPTATKSDWMLISDLTSCFSIGSVSVMASLVDSVLDVVSQVILWVCERFTRQPSDALYASPTTAHSTMTLSHSTEKCYAAHRDNHTAPE